jgi:hypothetical protein
VGHYAYLFTYIEMSDGFFDIVDVAEPTRPALISHNPAIGRRLVANSSHVFVAASNGGLQILDTSQPAAPLVVGRWLAPGPVSSVALMGSVAYISGGWNDFYIGDLSVPGAPVGIGYFRSPNYIQSVVVRMNRAYLIEGACTFDGCVGGLRILDVSDLTRPVELGSWIDTSGEAEEALIIDNLAYVTWAQPNDAGAGAMVYSIRRLDFSDPTNIRELESRPLPANGLAIETSLGHTLLARPVNTRQGKPVRDRDITCVPVERRGLYICRG